MLSRISTIIFVLFFFCINAFVTFAQIPCDEEYGQYCPEEVGYGVATCLKNSDNFENISQACKDYLIIHDVCKADIDTHCPGQEFTGDLISCLSEWTNPTLVSEACKEHLPKKEVKNKRKQTKEEKKKADKRRKIRNKATKMARDQL